MSQGAGQDKRRSTVGKAWWRYAIMMWAVIISVAGGLGVKSVSAQCQYELTLIPAPFDCPPFGPTSIGVLGLNDFGQAVGFVEHCDFRTQPFVWTEESGLMLLPFPPGENNGSPYDINNVLGADGIGQIICNFGPTGASRTYLFDDEKWTFFPSPHPELSSIAYSMNDSSELVGQVIGERHAVYWSRGPNSGVLLDLPVGPYSVAIYINEFSQITGEMGTTGPIGVNAFLRTGSTVLDLGTILGGDGRATGRFVDMHGLVGASTRTLNGRGEFETHVVRWDDGEVIVLTDATDAEQSGLVLMNELGQAIMTAGNDEAFDLYLWQHGHATLLNELFELGEFTGFSQPMHINNVGQFCSSIGTSEIEYGAIWTPINRPLGDVNCDCAVDEHDVLDVLRYWGPCAGLGVCPGDLVTSETFQAPGDGIVDAADLAVVLGDWTVPVSQPFNRRR